MLPSSWDLQSLTGCIPEVADFSGPTLNEDQHTLALVEPLWEELAALRQ